MTQRILEVWRTFAPVSSRRVRMVRRAGKPSWGGLLLRALPIALLLAGCGAESSERTINAVTIRSLPPVTTSAEFTDIEARLALSAAVEATVREHYFVTTVSVDDEITDTFVGTGAQQNVPWYLSDGGPDGALPLDALLDPMAVVVNEGATGPTIYSAVYDGAAVGVPDVDEVEVRVTIQDGKVTQVDYEMPVDGKTAEVVTVVTDRSDT